LRRRVARIDAVAVADAFPKAPIENIVARRLGAARIALLRADTIKASERFTTARWLRRSRLTESALLGIRILPSRSNLTRLSHIVDAVTSGAGGGRVIVLACSEERYGHEHQREIANHHHPLTFLVFNAAHPTRKKRGSQSHSRAKRRRFES